MENRRDFIKKAGLLAGSTGLLQHIPSSILAALSIDPDVGTSFLDAEHIVLLMQENRSFDHSFGTLKGVRGFNDPRAIKLPNQNPVWLQSYADGRTFAPFRLDIENSNAAWTSYLPHSWENQMAARNQGKHDNWLEAKRSDYSAFRNIPLTLGYYNRQDIPFYYAFADAFTICDQHFCSAITGTTTNRHFFWTGKCVPTKGAKPLIRNADTSYNKEVHWKTFPERLQEQNISWKIYQNEISLINGLDDKEPWLGNFTDNNLEWFTQYHVRSKKTHLDYITKRIADLPSEIDELSLSLIHQSPEQQEKLKLSILNKQKQLKSYPQILKDYGKDAYEKRSPHEQAIHENAFTTNEGDPNYREIAMLSNNGSENMSEMITPKGDILYQFRKDVAEHSLPTVSWLVAPQNFSDHPSAPMYGAWYVSEVLQILTQNPEIWKKTIFILNYDENDGYFDHVPPFVAPNPNEKQSGKTSDNLDYSTEYVTKDQELASGIAEQYATEGPVGLGYRVPLIIASPWSKGGWVNSEVCDITSTIQFLEYFIEKKYDKRIFEDNISSWRRAITGNLTSAFRPYRGEEIDLPTFLNRNEQINKINSSKSLPNPNNYKELSAAEIADIKLKPFFNQHLPQQELGIKDANPLAYELYIHGKVFKEEEKIRLTFQSSGSFFGKEALIAPYQVYNQAAKPDALTSWSFVASLDEALNFDWEWKDFDNKQYNLHCYGPNGFYRSFLGDSNDPNIEIEAIYEKNDHITENLILVIKNFESSSQDLNIRSNAYSNINKKIRLNPRTEKRIIIHNKKSFGWYDLTLRIMGNKIFRRDFAGKIETGKASKTDPQMGGL